MNKYRTLRGLAALILCLTLALVMPAAVFADDTASGGGSGGGGGSISADLDAEEDIDPILYIKSAEKLTLQAGEITQFPIIVDTRTGGYTADVRVTLSGTGDYQNAFTVQDPTGWYSVKNIIHEMRLVPTINVASNVPDGRYQLNVTFWYVNEHDQPHKSTDSVIITVYGRSAEKPYVASARFLEEEIGKENKSPLELKVANPGKSTIQNVQLAFVPAENSRFSLYEHFQPVNIDAINPGEAGTANFSMYMETNLASGNYPLTFTLSYKDPAGKIFTSTETVYAEVKRSADMEEGNTSKPRIIIQSYQTDVEMIEAGKSFQLDFTLQNTSTDTEVSNVKVVLGSEEAAATTSNSRSNSVFFPSEGSNSFFIERIAPKGSVSESIQLTTSQDIEPGVYSLTLNIEYDANGSAVTPSEEKLAFPVAQQQRLDIQGFSVESSTMMGSSVPVMFQYINKGKSTIYNFSVEVEGDFTLEDSTMSYIGNLSSGYNDTYENYLLPTHEGTCTGAILLKYEDSQGTEKEERKEVTVEVMSMDMPTGGDMGMDGEFIDGGMMPGEMGEPASNSTPIIIGCVIGAVVIGGGIAAFVILRKRKQAKEQAEDEED